MSVRGYRRRSSFVFALLLLLLVAAAVPHALLGTPLQYARADFVHPLQRWWLDRRVQPVDEPCMPLRQQQASRIVLRAPIAASSLFCVGSPHSPLARTCLLHNVCYDMHEQRWLYYLHANASRHLLPEERLMLARMPLCGLSPSVVSEQKPRPSSWFYAWPRPAREMPRPQSSAATTAATTSTTKTTTTTTTRVRWLSDTQTHVLIDPFWPENLGHAIGDDVLAVLEAATVLGVSTQPRDLSIWLARPLSALFSTRSAEFVRAMDFYNAIFPTISRRRAGGVDAYAHAAPSVVGLDPPFTDGYTSALHRKSACRYGGSDCGPRARDDAAHATTTLARYVCAPRLLVGTSSRGWRHAGRRTWQRLFHRVALEFELREQQQQQRRLQEQARHQLPWATWWSSVWSASPPAAPSPSSPPSPPPPLPVAFTKLVPACQRSVVFFQKKGRREIINQREAVAHLRRALWPRAKVELVDPVSRGSLLAQARWVRNYSVIITPPGGISFTSMFAAPGSSIIVVQYWDALQRRSTSMENFAYQNANALRVMPFALGPHDQYLPDSAAAAASRLDRFEYAEKLRNNGVIRVNQTRLAALVTQALYAASVSFRHVPIYCD